MSMNGNYKTVICASLLIGLLAISGCGKRNNNNQVSEELSFSFVDSNNGKKLVVNNEYETGVGAFGVLVAYDDIDYISPIFSSNYQTVEDSNGVYTCSATVTTRNGSKFNTIDTIYKADGRVKIDRHFTVEEVNASDLGFSIYFQIENKEETAPNDYKWFCPSAFYGNDEWTFNGSGEKAAFTDTESVISNDNSGIPLLLNYKDQKAFSILDTTGGFRETIASDYGISTNHILFDERFNIGGLGLKEVEINNTTHTQFFQTYPSHSYNFLGIYSFAAQYRMLPLIKGLTRDISFELNSKKYDSFQQANKEEYRYGYNHYAVIDKRYSAQDVLNATLEYLDKSYGVKEGVPQYMVNSDHPVPDSGFLYRNSDIAGFMLSNGRRLNNAKYISDALTVLDNQITNDRLDKGLVAGSDALYTKRASADALFNLCLAYKLELKNGVDHKDWLKYMLNKANERLESNKWSDAMFLTEFSRLSGSKTYLNKSIQLMNSVESDHLNYHFGGAITNPKAERLVEKEGGTLSLIIYVNLYELTNDKHWLDMAEKAALFVESFQIIQPICLDSYDNPGYGTDSVNGISFNQGFMGNKRFMPYGLNYICSQTTSADNMSLQVAPEFYKLFKYTNDSHYFDFYEYLTYNSVLYVNMGDKVGLMDDMLYSQGIGFQNEYFGISISADPAVYKRGSLHDSNLAWNVYNVLQNYERMREILGDGKIVAGDDEHREFDLKKNKYITKSNYGYVIDLNEVCQINRLEGYSGSFECSLDGENWVAGVSNSIANYVRVPGSAQIKELKVIGLPLTYRCLSYGDSVTLSDSNFGNAVDWNYSTYSSISANGSIILDLGSSYIITEVALKASSLANITFEVFVSSDGETYQQYGLFNNASMYLHTIEKNVNSIRYVKLVNNNAYSLSIKEFKILGI